MSDLIKGALQLDPWLEPYSKPLEARQTTFRATLDELNQTEGLLAQFADSYKRYGVHADPSGSVQAALYVPGVTLVALVGDFNQWDPEAHPLQPANDFGLWTLTIPAHHGECVIAHDLRYKFVLTLASGERLFRMDPWVRRATQPETKGEVAYEGRFWNPPTHYHFKHRRPEFNSREGIRIYEAHVGISTPEPKVGTYRNFTDNVLPLIKKLGYNTIQLMAVMEHAYYALFGYQVTLFFAALSRYGTPEELKELVDTAHAMGIQVLLDVVHLHSSKNVDDGLNMFNGTDHYLFHGGSKGVHEQWDLRLFNYRNHETLRFLLLNLKFYLEEYRFDGFRFDGVTLMLYKHHGLGFGFSGDYNEYFNPEWVDGEAITYLMLAHELFRQVGEREHFKFTLIAEDVLGMPTLCLPIADGGIGFDYRLQMAVPDMWIKLLKHTKDEDWDLGAIVFTLTNRRHGEPCIAYCESHDQALVGDKTLAFWLMDAAMYTHMSVLLELTAEIDRGIALHKMIRLVTFALGGEGYLNFEGNEFGHPEWLDFPREGNGELYHYARRQFNLIGDDLLRYKFLFAFDAAMQHLDESYGVLKAPQAYVSLKHEGDKVLVFERHGLVFLFNFHHSQSFPDYKIGIDEPGEYRVVLDLDREEYGGHARVDDAQRVFTSPEPWNDRRNSAMVYIPCRTVIVLARKEE